jgi:hypothetical protein
MPFCVDHAVATHPEAAHALPLGGELLALERLLAQPLDGGDDAPLRVARQSGELLERPPLPPNRCRGHA